MATIIPFRTKAPLPARTSAPRTGSHGALAAVEPSCRSEWPSPAPAREELRKTIILLDLAVQHGHEIARAIADPAGRRVFDRHLGAIEQALQIARERVIGL